MPWIEKKPQKMSDHRQNMKGLWGRIKKWKELSDATVFTGGDYSAHGQKTESSHWSCLFLFCLSLFFFWKNHTKGLRKTNHKSYEAAPRGDLDCFASCFLEFHVESGLKQLSTTWKGASHVSRGRTKWKGHLAFLSVWERRDTPGRNTWAGVWVKENKSQSYTYKWCFLSFNKIFSTLKIMHVYLEVTWM